MLRELESSDWYHAVTLPERIESLHASQSGQVSIEPDTEHLARQRMECWSLRYPHTRDGYLARCLLAHGISQETFLYILGEPIEAVRRRFPTAPQWLWRLRRAFASARSGSPSPSQKVPPGHEALLFLHVIDPLIRQARRRLHNGLKALAQGNPPSFFALEAIEDVLAANLPRHLVEILAPTLVLELHVARLQGSLTGETPEERFQSFVARLQQPSTALAILHEYPVLARHVLACLDNWVAYSLEFIGHLCADWQEIRATFCPAEDPGALVSLEDSKGDKHCRGRSILIATFSSGFQVVYKPKALALGVHFQELLAWLNERGANPPLGTLKILDRDSYGWAEYVSPRSCLLTDEVQRFYERQGEYLALLYALEATDFHYENLIAAGEHPVLVDLETLFQPYLGWQELNAAARRTAWMYRNSVLRVGLLPQRMFGNTHGDGIDLSGLYAAAGQPLPYPVLQWEKSGTDEMRLVQSQRTSTGGSNRPTLEDREVDVLDYVESLTRGFTSMYHLLLRHRDELLQPDGLLTRFGGDSVRVILRPTLTYGVLLRTSLHPDALRDGLERDVIFDWLWMQSAASSQLAKIVPAEHEDLHNGDVPAFTTYPGSCDVWASSGRRIPGVFDQPGMFHVRRRFEKLSETDLLQQLWFMRASLATVGMGQGHVQWSTPDVRENRGMANARDPLVAAQAIGDHLESLALDSEEGVSWTGLTLTAKDHWSLVPLGFDLYSGLPGVALFLAYLGAVSAEKRYTALARTIVQVILRHLQAHRVPPMSIGAFDGLGGLVYLLAHLGVLWNEPQLLREAHRSAEGLNSLIKYDSKFDITSGAAGCIMSLAALYRVSSHEYTLATAIQCGEHLLKCAQQREHGIAWSPYCPARGPLTGLAHGAAGIGWALLEVAGLSGERRFQEAALNAFKYEEALFSAARQNWLDLREADERSRETQESRELFQVGWCHGAPGIALTRVRSLRHLDNAGIRADIDAGLHTTLHQGFGGNHSLCHGDLGNLELLLQASDLVDESRWRPHVSRVGTAILESIQEHGWQCGVPLTVESPGLMTGLAGIGYGLLRLAEPLRVPAVLVLAPPGSESAK